MIRFRPLFGMTLCAVPALAILIGLGVWQIQRLHEKETLLAMIAERITAPETALADIVDRSPEELEWRRVRVTGVFLHDKEAYVHAIEPELGLGVHVLTPLFGDAGVVLVDRGFVPLALKSPSTRAEGQVEGSVVVSGLIRLQGERSVFTPAADPIERTWYWRDIEGITRTLPVKPRAPIVIVADQPASPGGLPRFTGYRVDIPNNHLQYALTWFGLALTLVGVYLVYHVRNGRLSFS